MGLSAHVEKIFQTMFKIYNLVLLFKSLHDLLNILVSAFLCTHDRINFKANKDVNIYDVKICEYEIIGKYSNNEMNHAKQYLVFRKCNTT